jgi:cytochrome c6
MNKYALVLFVLSSFFSCNIKKLNDPSQAVSSKSLTGADIYLERCVVCHGSDGKLGLSGAKNLTESTLPLDEVIRQVTTGKGAMAPFVNLLSKSEIHSVSEFTMTLRK